MRAETEKTLREIVVRRFRIPPGRIGPDSFLVDFGIDSLGALELIVEMEKAFGISIPDGDLVEIESVTEMVDYLVRRRSGS